jgi:hypothetical protein
VVPDGVQLVVNRMLIGGSVTAESLRRFLMPDSICPDK